ncbi:alpha/beta hydrolase family protein [Tamaricihabitans halophyticus]|uniref:Alpha/beta hydrolase family protein n=1 Tax=Tamaricihabitans halophyticus TaxID=1262583 RepID=A0A4R2QW99_9PSEU|nr:alpha/beta hydrolase [Tamaricihabitans halophyticus]TCP53977.1 alpha/beta hydrolase family protein [Tamaricihabitans halophyticus]
MVGYAELEKFERGLLDDVAQAWTDHADNLRDQAEAVATQINALGDWTGSAGEAARSGLADIKTLLEDSADEIDKIPGKVEVAADAINSAQKKMTAAIDEAPDYLEVSQSGEVDISAKRGSPEEQAAERRELQDAIDTAIKDATEADETAAGDIRAITPTEVGIDAGSDPGSTAKPIPKPGSDPEDVANWWNGLSAIEKENYLFSDSHKLGSLDGLPIEARDRANRFVLDEHESILEMQRDHGSPEDSLVASNKLDGVKDIQSFLQDHDDNGYLIGFDAENLDKDGQAIVSVGNPDTADNVATHVPGTGADLGTAGKELGRVERLQGQADELEENADNAAIYWLGYDAPDNVLPEATKAGYAEDGKDALSSFQEGLQETRTGDPSHNVVMGHSYGSTLIGHTVAEGGQGLPDDNEVVFVGSPGVGVAAEATATPSVEVEPAVDKLDIPKDQIWATRAENDAIRATPAGTHGDDPTAESFGLGESQVFHSERTSKWPLSAEAHGDYWDKDSQALENLGRIAVDQRPTTD